MKNELFYINRVIPDKKKKKRNAFSRVFLFSEVDAISFTVKILKIGTPEIITIIVLQLERLDFTVQYCAQKMQTE